MKGMILAAGLGTRMRQPDCPKPLTQVHGRALIEYRIAAFVAAGITDIVINVHHFAQMIQQAIGDGSRYGASIHYSVEPTLLNTGGGICQALPLLGDAPFIVVNADVWTDYPLQRLMQPASGLAHLVLVPNPAHHPQGDFSLQEDGHVFRAGAKTYTFAGISRFDKKFFAKCKVEFFGLGDLLLKQAEEGMITGEVYTGIWSDVGTPERLKYVEEHLHLQRSAGTQCAAEDN